MWGRRDRVGTDIYLTLSIYHSIMYLYREERCGNEQIISFDNMNFTM